MQYQGVEVGSDNAQNLVRASELSNKIKKNSCANDRGECNLFLVIALRSFFLQHYIPLIFFPPSFSYQWSSLYEKS